MKKIAKKRIKQKNKEKGRKIKFKNFLNNKKFLLFKNKIKQKNN